MVFLAEAILAVMAVSGCISDLTDESGARVALSTDKSRTIAREYVISRPEQRDYQGRNLTLAGTTPFCLPFLLRIRLHLRDAVDGGLRGRDPGDGPDIGPGRPGNRCCCLVRDEGMALKNYQPRRCIRGGCSKG